MAKAWNIQRRNNIGKSSPTPPPSHVDYDTWVGPAEYPPFQENRFHYNWHWWHNFGTGDIGNDGAHEMDIARWGLGVEGLPSLVTATGGKYYFDDDQQFPDNAMCTFEWPGKGGVGDRKPNADIEIGHQSVALIHLANIAIRTGRSLRIDPSTESILDDNESNSYCSRVYRKDGHWSIPKNS